MKELVFIRASYIVFLFVKTKNSSIIREIKPRQACYYWRAGDLLSNSPKRSPRFSPGYEGTENVFNFLNNGGTRKIWRLEN